METVSMAPMPALVMLSLVVLSYCARKFLPTTHAFQTPLGALLLAMITAASTAIASAIQANGLNGTTVVQAAVGAVMSLLASSNPSKPSTPAGGAA